MTGIKYGRQEISKEDLKDWRTGSPFQRKTITVQSLPTVLRHWNFAGNMKRSSIKNNSEKRKDSRICCERLREILGYSIPRMLEDEQVEQRPEEFCVRESNGICGKKGVLLSIQQGSCADLYKFLASKAYVLVHLGAKADGLNKGGLETKIRKTLDNPGQLL